MSDRSSSRLDSLNRSINRKLDEIEGHAENISSTSKSRATKRSGKSGLLAEAPVGKTPRMMSKQSLAPPLGQPASMPVKSIVAASRIWSLQSSSPGSLIEARYKLIGGNYVEESVQDSTPNDALTMTVEMGDLKTVTGDELIQTRSMSDCSSIVLLTDFDPDKKTYGKRSLAHMQGSNLSSMEEPEKIADSLCAQAKTSKGRPLMILATGIISSSWLIDTMVIPVELCSESGVVRQPLRELMALCDAKILPLTLEITIWPDGSLLAKHDYSMRNSWGSDDKRQ